MRPAPAASVPRTATGPKVCRRWIAYLFVDWSLGRAPTEEGSEEGGVVRSRRRPRWKQSQRSSHLARVLSDLARQRHPIALAIVGVLLILVVVQSALAGLDRVAMHDDWVAALSRIARAHQDADMEHDALHADVSRLLTRAPDSSPAQ